MSIWKENSMIVLHLYKKRNPLIWRFILSLNINKYKVYMNLYYTTPSLRHNIENHPIYNAIFDISSA